MRNKDMYVGSSSGRGIGDAQTHQLIVGSMSTGLGLSAGLLVAAGVSGPAAPILAVAAGVVALVGTLVGNGCGQTCVAATRIVNQIEPYLKQNVDAYLAGDRTYDQQQYALGIFDKTWQLVLEGCGNADLAEAGKRCIGDRARGGKWDWFSYYRDPIANDPNVIKSVNPVLGAAGNVIDSAAASLGLGSNMAWILPVAGLVILGMVTD